MNRTLAFALAVGLVSITSAATPTLAVAQTAPAAAPTAPTSVKPEAVNAKVAIVAFEQAVVATNEGQKVFADLQKKYEPKKATLDALAQEVDSLKKQVQALPANTPDDERASRLKAIDTKEKQLQRDGEDATNAYQSDVQEGMAKIAQKLGATAVKYCQDNGFTLLLNESASQQAPNPVLWFAAQTDITQAVINAYNASSGVAAQPPAAPAPRRSAPAAPAKK